MMPEKHHGELEHAGGYDALHPGEPRLRINKSACLPARSPMADCKACATICPVSALALGEQGPALVGDCLGCGRCATRCPSDALHVQGFPDVPLPGQAAPVVRKLDCWRVPESEGSDETLRVPCTGGVDASQLLSLNRLAGPGGISVLDRGWCDRCPAAGGAGHPAEATVRQVNALLEEAGAAPDSHPRLSAHPLPQHRAAAAIPDARLERPVSRRGFLRQLGAEALSARARLTADLPPARSGPLIVPLVPLRRLRLGVELRALTGTDQGPSTLPRLSVSSRCEGHGICAALCPTGALERRIDGQGSRLVLSADRCIGCRLCERVCPEQAIRLEATQGGALEQELHRLTRQRCRRCGQACNAGDTGEDSCRACRKSDQLMRAVLTRSEPDSAATRGEGSR